jgi:tetratricopeptide (TPR) repeat protein
MHAATRHARTLAVVKEEPDPGRRQGTRETPRAAPARGLLAALLLAASVLAPHWPRERADFTFDDVDFIETNQSIRSLPEAFAALLAPFPPDQPERGLYRPLTSLAYALDHRIGGGAARAFHRDNVLLYGVVVALVYRLARTYGRSPGFALSLALLFAVHPVHCDAVDAVAGRSELLALLFSLAALLAFLRTRQASSRRSGAWLAASAGAYALACAAKETAVVLPAILAVHAWMLAPAAGIGPRARALARLLPHAAVLVLYLAARLAALERFAPSEPLMRGIPFEIRLHTVGRVFLENLRLLVFPRVLEIDFYYLETVGVATGGSPAALAGLAALTAAAGALAWLLLRRAPEPGAAGPPDAHALTACGLALFLGFLLPVSHVFDFGALMAERFLFAPSLGFLLLVVLAGARAVDALPAPAPLRRAVAAALVGALALAGSVRSAARAAEWRDSVGLWLAADRDLPDHPMVLSNLASAWIERGDHEAADAVLERGLARDPHNVPMLGSLGNLRMAQRRLSEARAAFEHVLRLAPEDFVTWNNLGVLEVLRDRPADAIPLFQRSLAINPNFAEARRNLADVEAHLRRRPAVGSQMPTPPQGSR